MTTMKLRRVLDLVLVTALLLTGVSCAVFGGKPKAREKAVASIAYTGMPSDPSFFLSLHPDPCLLVEKGNYRKSKATIFPLSSEEYQELRQLWQAAYQEFKTVKQRTDRVDGANVHIALEDDMEWVSLKSYAKELYDLPALEKLQTKLRVHYPHFY